ncbi:MAG TPA: methylenetetrahydrofolate reductase [Candidatus Humimicrobiaceae bacterium]|jgi:5,10-methylenetetrahydrofolate reductase|nr:methylenetetrahydrofolate reductase [Candidatus Humimicrobiaceae bacterium]
METVEKSKFEKTLEEGKFAVTCEIGPPKGAGIEEIREAAEELRDIADGINVTDLQSSVMRLGSLVTCHLLKDWGLDPIFQVTCRDRNRLILQSDLLSAYVMGIRNILALTGDYTTTGDHPQAEPVFDLDSVQLLWAIKNLEEGKDLAGKELTQKPSFFKGAVVNPGADTEASYELQIIKMKKKIDQGAQFFQTQAIFDAEVFKRFMERIHNENMNVPVLAGIILLKSEKMANYMNKFVPGVFVPETLVKKMEGTQDKVSMCIEIASGLIEEVKKYCAGVHIQALGWEKHVSAVVKNLK